MPYVPSVESIDEPMSTFIKSISRVHEECGEWKLSTSATSRHAPFINSATESFRDAAERQIELHVPYPDEIYDTDDVNEGRYDPNLASESRDRRLTFLQNKLLDLVKSLRYHMRRADDLNTTRRGHTPILPTVGASTCSSGCRVCRRGKMVAG